jgi:pantoate--beta-alanine ligase
MQVINTIIDLRKIASNWRFAGERIAFVPTMGNLHAGHLKLVEVAKLSADRVVVSVFVNPTQFGVDEDFEAYPRTEAEDKQKLAKADVDLLFLPSVAEMYSKDAKTLVSVKGLSTLHCGTSRPGHFDGVATVVCKLFNMVQPDVAFFGQKDFQQVAVIRAMVSDLNIPVEIRSIPTVRESSGLAMSSRNGYLSLDELQVAPKLYEALCTARDEILTGEKDFETIENKAVAYLKELGFMPDYFSICNPVDLLKADTQATDFALLAAAKLGRTRLIDNICFSIA